MRITEICLLPFERQSQILYDQAVYIGKQKKNGRFHILFQLDGFYVEVVYATYRQHIEMINYSTSIKVAEPYLPEMDIEVLVNVF